MSTGKQPNLNNNNARQPDWQ